MEALVLKKECNDKQLEFLNVKLLALTHSSAASLTSSKVHLNLLLSMRPLKMCLLQKRLACLRSLRRCGTVWDPACDVLLSNSEHVLQSSLQAL